MTLSEIQIVSNENGEPTAVIVPIEMWREIESERETRYLLSSEAMKNRILDARSRGEGIEVVEGRESGGKVELNLLNN